MSEKYIPIIDLASALYINQLQKLEDKALVYLNMINVESATNAQLDIIGDYVNLNRNGLDDDIYKLFIKAEIVANASRGRMNELLTSIELLTGNSNNYIMPYTKAIDVYADVDSLLGQYIVEFLERAVEAGTKVATVQPYSTAGFFGFSDFYGETTDADTFGDATDPAVGGAFSYIITGG